MSIKSFITQQIGRLKHPAAGIVLIAAMASLEVGCGDVFRPVEIPVPQPSGDPKLYHFVMMINDNGSSNPGTALQIDVSGDSDVGEANMGRGPVHAALLPSGSRTYVANSLDDTVSVFSPAPPCFTNPCLVTGLGTPSTITLPAGAHPSFVHTAEFATMYVIMPNLAPPAVGVISAGTNVLLRQVPVGNNPVAMVETPNGRKLYVVNQGDNTVTVINSTDHSVAKTVAVGPSPTFAVTTPDSSAIYVLNEGNGTISEITTFTDTVIATLADPGAGANSLYYDTKLNRLYITNGTANTVTIYDASVVPPGVPTLIKTVSLGLAAGFRAIRTTALANGSKAYILSYQDAAGVVSTQLTAISELTNTVSATMSIGTAAADICADTPARFSVASSPESDRVYVAHCDAGAVYNLRTSDNVVVSKVSAPFSAQPPVGNVPPPQNPVFLLAGR